MKVDLPQLGDKLKILRQSLNISQKDLAEKLEIGQNSISRLENGLGGSIPLLLAMLHYYSKHHSIRFVMEDEDIVIVRKDQESGQNHHTSIAVARIKLLQAEVNKELNDIAGLL